MSCEVGTYMDETFHRKGKCKNCSGLEINLESLNLIKIFKCGYGSLNTIFTLEEGELGGKAKKKTDKGVAAEHIPLNNSFLR